MNADDRQDVARFGVCWCGKPRRQYIEEDDEGRPIYISARCDDGHEIEE
jgi:hypothetical protein